MSKTKTKDIFRGRNLSIMLKISQNKRKEKNIYICTWTPSSKNNLFLIWKYKKTFEISHDNENQK